MPVCKKCGYNGSKNEVKKAPKNLKDYSDKYICFNCYKDFKNKKNTLKGKDEDKNNEKISCIYCGSPIDKDSKICQYCNYDFEKKKLLKREKNAITGNKKNYSKSKKDNIFLKTEEEIKKSIPKKYRILPFISFLFIVVICLLLFSQTSFFSVIIDQQNKQAFLGEWNLLDMNGPADDNFDQKWIFCKNNTLRVETDYDDNEKEDLVNSFYWEKNDDDLRISIPFSEFKNKKIFNVETTTYKTHLSNKNRKLTLLYESNGIDMEMCLKKI